MPGADGNKAGSAWEEAKRKATRPGTKEAQSTSRSGCLHYPLGDMEHKVRSRIQAFACMPVCLAFDMLPMLPTNISLCGFVRQTARLERKSIGLLRLAGAYHRPTSEDRKVTQLTSFASCLLLRKAPVTQARRCLPAGRPEKNCRCSAERLDMLSLPSSCATLAIGCYGLPWWGRQGCETYSRDRHVGHLPSLPRGCSRHQR